MLTSFLPSTLFKVVDILNDCQLHSGAEVAVKLGISRTAVWKAIQRLRKYNIHIQTHHQGYLLNSPLILLEKKKIESALKDTRVKLTVLGSIPSTSYYLRDKLPLENFNFCIAEHQTNGRGRLGRSWSSPFGKNIYFSFSYIFNKSVSEISGLSLIIAIVIAQALEALSADLKPFLKWPNDIYINNQKVGGILIDLMMEAHGNCKAIISVGLNVNMKDINLKELNEAWISLEHMLNIQLDRNSVIAHLIKSLLKGIDIFLEKGMEPFLLEWKRYDLLKDKEISINVSGKTLSGVAKGINKDGFLLLKLQSGAIEKISCGDVTLSKN